MSDSDSGSSNSSSSWIYVNEDESPADVSPNHFYLNCSKEPVQELTENDLGVVHSDNESDDSDGISIISEPEVSSQITSSDELPKNCSKEDNNQKESIRNISLVQPVVEERLQEVPTNSINLRKIFITTSLISAGVVAVAILISPYISTKAQKYASTRLGWSQKQHTSDFPLFYCHKKEHKYTRSCIMKVEIGNFGTANNSLKEKFMDGKSRTSEHLFSSSEMSQIPNNTDPSQNHVNYQDRKLKIEELRKKENKLHAKEEYLTKKEEYLIKKEYDLIKRELKIEEKLNHLNTEKKKAKYKYREDKQHIHNLLKKEETGTHDGYWQIRLNKERERLREQKQESDWLFERAAFRKKTRNQARWYFQWMVSRERNRSKKMRAKAYKT